LYGFIGPVFSARDGDNFRDNLAKLAPYLSNVFSNRVSAKRLSFLFLKENIERLIVSIDDCHFGKLSVGPLFRSGSIN
jgi:hypothetical protein